MMEETQQEQQEPNQRRKALIGVLASHDSPGKNRSLAELFVDLYRGKGKKKLKQFHFLLTDGTFKRIVSDKGPMPIAFPNHHPLAEPGEPRPHEALRHLERQAPDEPRIGQGVVRVRK